MDKRKTLLHNAKQAIAKLEGVAADLEAAIDYDAEQELFTSTFMDVPCEFNDIAVQPCREKVDGRGREKHVEVCAPKDADFWSLYVKDTEGLSHWLADFPNEKDANNMERWLRSFAFLWRPKEEPRCYKALRVLTMIDQRFPELTSDDDELNGGDAVDRLTDLWPAVQEALHNKVI